MCGLSISNIIENQIDMCEHTIRSAQNHSVCAIFAGVHSFYLRARTTTTVRNVIDTVRFSSPKIRYFSRTPWHRLSHSSTGIFASYRVAEIYTREQAIVKNDVMRCRTKNLSKLCFQEYILTHIYIYIYQYIHHV